VKPDPTRAPHWTQELWTIPNCITCARFPLTALLFWVADVSKGWFLALYVLTFLSDVLDGYLARRLKMESYLGMRLDSYADYLLMASSLWWAWRFSPRLFLDHRDLWIAMGAVLAVPQAIALVRLGRNAGFHLYSTKAAGWIAFALFLSAVAFDYSVTLLYALAAAVVVKSAEESAICLLVDDPYADPRPTLLSYLRSGILSRE
jgi:CDP-diacylglycerol--glycerol-3-phosphate 3-phosphatidyltransferase